MGFEGRVIRRPRSSRQANGDVRHGFQLFAAQQLAHVFSRYGIVRVVKPPITLPPFALSQYWHPRFHSGAVPTDPITRSASPEASSASICGVVCSVLKSQCGAMAKVR